jgi:hypothetical protein
MRIFKYTILLLLLVLSVGSCVPESDEFSDISVTSGATIDPPANQSFIDGVTEEVKIPVSLLDGSDKGIVKSIDTYITFTPGDGEPGEEKLLQSFTTFPDTIVLDKSKLIQNSTKTASELGAGDVWTIRYVINTNGIKITPLETVDISFACVSDLEKTYNTVSSGESTDSHAENNPTVNFESEATFTRIDDTSYELSDAFGGLYLHWYGEVYGVEGPQKDAVVTDVCGKLTVEPFVDFFGVEITGSGSYGENGELIIEWTNEYGDMATTTYTPQ